MDKTYEKYPFKMVFFKRITLVVVAAITLVLVSSTVFLLTSSYHSIASKDEVIREEAISKLHEEVSAKYTFASRQSILAHTSDHVADKLRAITQDSSNLYHHETVSFFHSYLQALLASDRKLLDVLVFPVDLDFAFSASNSANRTVRQQFDYDALPVIIEATESDKNITLHYASQTPYLTDPQAESVTIVVKIYGLTSSNSVLGYLLLDYSVADFDEVYQELGSYTTSIAYVTNEAQTVIYSTKLDEIGTAFDSINFDEKSDISNSTVRNSGICVRSISSTKMESTTQALVFSMILISIVSFSTVLIVIVLSYGYYSRTFHTLMNAVKHVETTDFQYMIPINRMDEMGQLSAAFNHMCQRVNEYAAKNYENGIARGIAERNALQAQINPHFLYNTIDSIRMAALNNNDYDAAEMLDKLGLIFRGITDFSDDTIPLEEELDYINTYIDLQQIRFMDRFSTCIDVPDDLYSYQVPKFVLQPLVENAIAHNLSKQTDTGVHITIRAQLQSQDLVLSVSDDGMGISKHTLSRLRRHIHSEIFCREFGIGMRNVHNRIQLAFGEAYGLELESVPDKGTTILIRIPVINE